MPATPAPAPAPAPAPREPETERRPYNFGAAVYGLIAVSGLLAAETASRETYAKTVLGVVVALLLYWLAHAYSEFVYHRVEAHEKLTRAGLVRTLRWELPILIGAAPPLIEVLIAWVVGASLGTGITIALWVSAATILVAEVIAGLQAELTARQVVMQALVGTALGVLVLVLRLVLH